MTRIVSFSLSDEFYGRLKECASKAGLTVSKACRAALYGMFGSWRNEDPDSIPFFVEASHDAAFARTLSEESLRLRAGRHHRVAVGFGSPRGSNLLDGIAIRFRSRPSMLLRLAVVCWVSRCDGDARPARRMTVEAGAA